MSHVPDARQIKKICSKRSCGGSKKPFEINGGPGLTRTADLTLIRGVV